MSWAARSRRHSSPSSPNAPRVPQFSLSSAPRALNTAQAAVLAGARAFVVKPVSRDELLASVRQVLAHAGNAPAA